MRRHKRTPYSRLPYHSEIRIRYIIEQIDNKYKSLFGDRTQRQQGRPAKGNEDGGGNTRRACSKVFAKAVRACRKRRERQAKKELLTMSENLKVVPYNGAQDFGRPCNPYGLRICLS